MARGSIAKEKVIEKISAALGPEWIGKYDNKYYCWANENGENVQIAITLTCPKNNIPVESVNVTHTSVPQADFNWETTESKTSSQDDDRPPWEDVKSFESKNEVTQNEIDNLEALLKRCGL